MTKIIGLTGGIGSGKSTVLKMFQKHGATAFIADEEAKKLMNFDEDLKRDIKKLLGEKSYKNNRIDKKFIAEQIFNDSEKIGKLNSLVHPKVKETFLFFAKEVTTKLLVYEAAILFESGSDVYCDFVVTVIADKEKRIQRVMKRDNVSRKSVLSRMKNQLSDTDKIEKSDFVIYNNEFEDTESQVKEIVKKISNGEEKRIL